MLSGIITKPFNMSTLFDAIMTAWGRAALPRRSRDEAYLETVKDIQGARILLVEDNEINGRSPWRSCKTPDFTWKKPTTAVKGSPPP